MVAMHDEFYLNVQIAPLEEGGFLATSDQLPGLVAQGRTVSETMEIAQDVARKLIESCLDHGDPLPKKIQAALKTSHQKTVVKIPIQISAEAA
jgi:antitoxin HicB